VGVSVPQTASSSHSSLAAFSLKTADGKFPSANPGSPIAVYEDKTADDLPKHNPPMSLEETTSSAIS
jgi:hypothetical protein